MASVKIATLLIRTIAKPISNSLKNQAKQHPRFRDFCVGLAQRMHRTEIRARYHLLGQEPKAVRPLNERTAVENGANAIAEGFLFSVAAGLIIAEQWRSSRKESKRREGVEDRIDELVIGIGELQGSVQTLRNQLEEEKERNEQMARVLGTVVQVGLHTSMTDFLGVRSPSVAVKGDSAKPTSVPTTVNST